MEEKMRKCFQRGLGLVVLMTAVSFGWTSGEITVDVTNDPMDIAISAGGKTIANITEIAFGNVKYTAILEAAPAEDALVITLADNTSIQITGVDGGIHFTSTNPAVENVRITMEDLNEHFYGITEHNINENPDLRGKNNILDQVRAYQRAEEDAEVYSGFVYTTLGYAMFFDSFAEGAYSFASGGKTTVTYRCPLINWYIFYGPKLSKIQKSYYKIIGAPLKVPMWACGPLVWHDDYTGSDMILDHAEQFTQLQIPYSTIWLDRPYNNGSKGWSNMNFEGTFGNPEVWIKTLTEDYYVHLVTWTMPGTFEGTPPDGAFTSSPNNYFDLTDPTQVEYYRNKLIEGQYAYGVYGHKLDRVDNGWSPGELPEFKDGTPAPERHKKYAYINCKIHEEFLRVDAGRGDDFFSFPRCAVAGCQKFTSAIWNGDSYADWNGMITSIGNAFRAGILGFPMWGSDIGGYNQKGMPSIENYCRWLLYGVYSGFMELMLDGKEPWKLSEENQAHIRDIFNLRFTLLPYIYSIINTSDEDGVTMKPLVGEYPDDPNVYAMVDEHLFGPSMLVAPLISEVNTRSVYLPEARGHWINTYDWNDMQAGGTTITSPPMGLTQIPVYIKLNSIHPTGKVFGGLTKKWDPEFDSKRNLVINAFPGYDGDTSSFTYVDYLDDNKHKEMTLNVVGVGDDCDISITAPAMTVPTVVVVRMWETPESVSVGGVPVEDPQYDAATKRLTIPVADAEPIDISITAVKQRITHRSTAFRVHGRITVKHTAEGVCLAIPPLTGIGRTAKATVTVFDIAGRVLLRKIVSVAPDAVTPVSLSFGGKGTYIARVKSKGVEVGKVKILAQ